MTLADSSNNNSNNSSSSSTAAAEKRSRLFALMKARSKPATNTATATAAVTSAPVPTAVLTATTATAVTAAAAETLPDQAVRLVRLFKQVNSCWSFISSHVAKTSLTSSDSSSSVTLAMLQSSLPKDALLTIEDVACMSTIAPGLISWKHIQPDSDQQSSKEKTRAWLDCKLPSDDDDDSQPTFAVHLTNVPTSNISTMAPASGQGDQMSAKRMRTSHSTASSAKSELVTQIAARNSKFEECAARWALKRETWDSLYARALSSLPFHSTASMTESLKAPITMPSSTSTLVEQPRLRYASQILAAIQKQPFYINQLSHQSRMRSFPPRPPTYVDTADVVPDESVRRALHGVLNITQLYSHQASAIEAYRHGDCDVVVTTPTASGKSLIYQLAVIDTLTNEPNARVLCLFPTKALARDQLRSMGALLKAIPHLAQHQVAAYDGDTPINSSSGGTMASMVSMTAIGGGIAVANERKTIREQCSVIVTNPDMLHTAILPGGMTYWRKVLYNLRLVVLDELHEYDALFGSHTALIMRRLLRLCHALGNDDVRFVSCSATIANPGDHLRLICGRNDDDNVRTVVVSNDGSPAAGKEYVLWQAPLLSKISGNKNIINTAQNDDDDRDDDDNNDDNAAGGNVKGQSASTAKNIHRNSMDELADIVVFLMHHGVRHIVFCRSRTTCERAHSVITSRLSRMSPASLNLQSRLATYRGGYSAVERRRIEQEMHDGTLLCVIATSALEIGIDVGDLDATVTLGIPRNISSLHQQAGRAGRRVHLDTNTDTDTNGDINNDGKKEKKSALVIIVATNDYHGKQVCSKPELMFDMPSALLRVDVNEPSVLEAHLHCAASELPIALPDDTRYFPVAEDICTTALVYDELNQRARGTGKRVYLTHPRYQPHPSSRVSIRGTIEDTFVMAILRQHAPPSSRGIDIADRGNNVTGKVSGYVVLEEIEMSRALYQVYDDGVFLHGGKSYLMSVTKEYLEQKLAVVKPTSVKYVTRPDDSVSIITDSGSLQQSTILASSDTAEWTCRFGLITVQVQYYGYSKLTTATLTEIEKVDHPSPPQAFKTSGLWIDIPLSVVNELEARSVDVYVAAHGVSHMLGKIAENRVLGKPGFLQTECGAYVRSSNALSSGHDAGSSDAKNGEVDGESKVTSAGVLSAARILLYESKAGTSSSSTSAAAEMFGLCRVAYVSIKDILRDARTSIAECTCISAAEGEDRASHEELGSCVESSFDGGCRECIRGPGCRILMCTLSKSGSLALLDAMLNNNAV